MAVIVNDLQSQIIWNIKQGLEIKNFPTNPNDQKSNIDEQKKTCALFYEQIKELLPVEGGDLPKEVASLLARLCFVYGKQFCYAKLENGEGFRQAARLHELAIAQLLRSHSKDKLNLPLIDWNKASFDDFVSTLGKIEPPSRLPLTEALDNFVIENSEDPASALKKMQLPDEELKVLHDSFRQLAYSQQNIPGMLPLTKFNSAEQSAEEQDKWNFMKKIHTAYEAFALASITLKPSSEETTEDTCERAEILYNRAIVLPRFNEGGLLTKANVAIALGNYARALTEAAKGCNGDLQAAFYQQKLGQVNNMTSRLCQAVGAPVETTLSMSEMAIARYRENIKIYEQQPDKSEFLHDQLFLLNNAYSIYIDQLTQNPSLITEERKTAIKTMAEEMKMHMENRRKIGQDHTYFSGYQAIIALVEKM